MYTANITKTPRQFLPAQFTLTTWPQIAPYFEQLLAADITSVQQLQAWLVNVSELEAVVSEDACWRQIRMTCDTTNTVLEDAFTYFCVNLQPHIQQQADALNKKLLASPYIAELHEATYYTYLRSVKKSIELYKEENLPLQAELSVAQQQFGTITGAMSVVINEQEYTLQQADKFLENEDRLVRELAYHKINDRRLQDTDTLNTLFDKLLQLRNTIATNAGYKSYTDFRFKELGRFDYTVADCEQFHEGIKHHVMPLVNSIYQKKQQALGLTTLHPYDVEAEPQGVTPLHPFNTGAELLQKTIACFEQLDPLFASCLTAMQGLQHFDLESRKGKAPGGYNCPLAESGAPFIFMNAAGQMSDVTTMVHEGGHAIHSFLAHPLPLTAFKEYPMEIAEVASMAMELFSMEYWHVFFDNKDELKRAKLHQLERVITIFPWIATIDKFQHWLYSNPNHTQEQRSAAWVQISAEFASTAVNLTGLEHYKANSWQRQLHLYEVPFYYIEYGIAQLGAIGLYMQYKQNKKQALSNYCKALSLGGTKTLPELYAAAGLTFSLSPTTINTYVSFIQAEMESIMAE